jgi:hypothetical protein
MKDDFDETSARSRNRRSLEASDCSHSTCWRRDEDIGDRCTRVLLDAWRERLELTGTKKGCARSRR